MLMVEPHSAARFCAANFYASTRLLSHSSAFVIQRNKYRRCASGVKGGHGIRAAAKAQSGSDSGPVKQNAKPQRYHPSEEIAESDLLENGEVTLSPAETARTIIEVNSKATLMFTGMANEEVHQNIFWPDLPYLTDEHGNIYFQVKNDEDILQTITAEENIVQVIIGLNTAELISEMEELGRSEISFGMDELDDEDSDFDDDEDEEDEDEDDGDDDDDDDDDDEEEDEWVSILDEEDQDEESDGSLGDWANLETMRSSHPMYFAKKLADVVSEDPIDCMEQPSAGLVIQGLLRPAFIEEHSIIQKHISGPGSSDLNTTNIAEEGDTQINGHRHKEELPEGKPGLAEELEKDETLENGFAFYKVEMIKIQLVSAHGHQNNVEIEDFRMAQPDAIAHSAEKIIARLKAGAEKTMQALKSLCWRCKGIQVEECALIGVDSLGFDLRICSGAQVQTLRFAFKKRASSEYSAERQLNDLLFPRAHKHQQKKAQQTES
ncbi:Ubiquitinyl hydrolase 1 [Handroanthus impetiginosus]|uniref:Ubiquitinyl hydrolase 1 n=1 Tax=Handroanthus impetiginosus TaxID=429701 RepID=A0A2G9HFH9_9LAMI|nr:Ubiquitinyl hydrolase 1 [Handroanthus impetiginosus]